MALLAGIDEAGYGPHLGPLVVAAAALEFPHGALPDPDLWETLGGHVRKTPAARDGRVLVCDSKLAYAPARGLANLERTVLGFLAAGGIRPATLAALLGAIAVPSSDSDPAAETVAAEPWHRPATLALPMAATAEEIESAATRFDAGLGAVGGRVGRIWASLAAPARFNRLVKGGRRNKAEALFLLNADLLARLGIHAGGEAVHVTIDRHGGRRFYGDLLAGAFPMHEVTALEESAAQSRYRLAEGGAAAPMDLTIRERCESWSLATALASMAAKYVRELQMHELNAFFAARVPGLRPTAGYGLDAWRFLDDVAAARAAAGVPDEAILRSR